LKKRRRSLTILLILLPLLVVASAAAASTFFKLRDELAQHRAAIGAQWREVNAAFDERAALVEELARKSAVGAAVLQEVKEARAAGMSAATPQARIQANLRLSGALAKVLVSLESRRRVHPPRSVLRLEEEINDSDARIAVARRKYNETLEHYNARIQRFPLNLVARISGFTRNDAYFYTEPF